jgi:hypothetical protein
MAVSEASKKGSSSRSITMESGAVLTLTDDRMQLLLDATLPADRIEALVAEVTQEMVKLGIAGSSDLSTAATVMREAAKSSGDFEKLVLLEGVYPKSPKDAQVLWARDFFRPGFAVDSGSGAINWREKASDLTVLEGELLASVSAPEPGEDGRDLLGKAVPARKSRMAQVRVGRNVRRDDEDGSYYASMAGRVRFVNDVLTVDDVLTVAGSVGLRTGNIRHPGALVISQNIDADSKVTADGDIEVNGTIENAEVHSAGNLLVHGGITGGPECVIKATGTIHARFIQNATIEAGGDVAVEHGIDQCHIKTRGAVVTHGRIVGGEIMALCGIEAQQIGTDAYVKTTLIAGEDYTLKEKIVQKEQELEQHRDRLQKISEKVTPLKEKIQALPPKAREAITLLLQEAGRLSEVVHEFEEEIERLRQESKGLAKKEVTVQKVIMPDAFFQMHPLNLLIKEIVQGPVCVALHEANIRILHLAH